MESNKVIGHFSTNFNKLINFHLSYSAELKKFYIIMAGYDENKRIIL